jgi:ABC-type Fe3+-hydroxamate transport system substrate-binding protein
MLLIDHMGRHVECPNTPNRIISLVPSQTELLYDLGLGDRVVGITRFCIYPTHWFKTKTRVGGTKDVSIPRVAALKPDLVIANREENVKEQIEQIERICPVWISDIADLPAALQMILSIGRLTDTTDKACALAQNIEASWKQTALLPPYRVLYLIWKDPWMCAGSDTFIDDLLTRSGLINCAPGNRYPILTDTDLRNIAPDLLLLSSEPYPFKEKHITQLSALLPKTRIVLTDGDMWSWYGSRLLHSAAYVAGLQKLLK